MLYISFGVMHIFLEVYPQAVLDHKISIVDSLAYRL